MHRVELGADWPESWRKSYEFDELEVWGRAPRSGYATAWQRRHSLAIDAVTSVTPTSGRVLDVAAAQGNFTLVLAEAGYSVTWNDLRADLIGYVSLKQDFGNITFEAANAFDLVPTIPFDTVLMTEVIEHVAHPDQFLSHAATLVKPGGHVVLTTPNGEYFRNKLPRFSDFHDTSHFEAVQFQPDADGHIFLLHRDEILRLSHNANLEVVGCIYFTNPLTAGHLKLARLLRALPVGFVHRLEGRSSSKRPGRLRRRTLTQMLWILRKPQPLSTASAPQA